jgi:hypothetical protein
VAALHRRFGRVARRVLVVCSLGAAIAASSSPAAAQRVTGTVTDQRSATPLAGAVVSATTASGGAQAVNQTLTDRQGRFVLIVADTTRRLLVRKIGFQPRTITLTDDQHAGRAPADVGLSPVPQVLDAVVSNGLCPASPTAGQASALWEQARAGFLAAVVARDAMSARVRVLRVDREYEDGIRGSIVRRAFVHDTSSSRTAATVRDAAALAREGYVTTPSGFRVTDAPDADVLLDPAFSETHCFSLTAGDAARSRQLGIAFQPIRGREGLVDVQGVLWLDTAPLALREVTFAYVGSRAPVKVTGGGRLSFRAADNGVVVVDEWSIVTDAMLSGKRVRPVSGRIEQAGYLVSARWPDGTTVAPPLSTLTGTVVDADTKKPVPSIAVAIDGTQLRGWTDRAGRFSIPSLAPGPYELVIDDTSYWAFNLDWYGEAQTTVERGRDAAVRLELASPLRAARARCTAYRGVIAPPPPSIRALGYGAGTVAVRVVGGRGDPITGRTTIVAKLDVGGRITRDSVRTDGEPISICRVAAGVLTVTARDSADNSGQVQLLITGDEVLDTLTIVMPARSPTPHATARPFTFTSLPVTSSFARPNPQVHAAVHVARASVVAFDRVGRRRRQRRGRSVR